MPKHRTTTGSRVLLEGTTRLAAGVVLATGILVVGMHVVPAHANTATATEEFKHIEDEGNTMSLANRLTIDAWQARKHEQDKQRASRAHRALLEKQRPKWVRPVSSGVSSPFGYRWGRFHSGIDFVANIGTPVHAAGDGTVIWPTDGTAGYGNVICIRHPDGAVTWYAHLSSKKVDIGQQVKAGDLIGLSGATGNVTGPHVHFEVRFNNKPVDPLPWLRHHGVSI